MITILLAALNFQSDAKTFYPVELLSQFGYEFNWSDRPIVIRSGAPMDSTARHRTNNSVIKFRFTAYGDDIGKEISYGGKGRLREFITGDTSGKAERTALKVDSNYVPASTSNWHVEMPSGLPAGTDSATLDDQGHIGSVLKNRFEIASVHYRDGYIIDDKGTYFEERDRSTEKNMVEAASRIFFARIVGRRMETAPKRRVGSSDVKAFKNSKSDKDHVDVKEWALARGWQWTKDDSIRIGTLTRGNRTITVPLASAYILVDDQWVELSDVIAEKESRWLVPLDEIEAAHRGD